MRGKDEIIRRLFRKRYSSRTVRLSTEIAAVAGELYGHGKYEAIAYADRITPSIWTALTKRLDEEARKQLNPTFEILDSDRFELIWHPAFRSRDSSKTKARKVRLAHRGAVLDTIDALNDRQYEALGCLLMKIGGASKWHLTPPGNEFGIDFLALVPAFGSGHLLPHTQKQLRVVGQAKKWNFRVKRDHVDLLTGTLERIRGRHLPLFESGVLPPWFVSADGLLVGVMLAHLGTQSGGHDVAADRGIILADSRDAAELIALCREWDPFDDGYTVVQYLQRGVQEILTVFEQ